MMKNTRALTAILALMLCGAVFACKEPSPLYGKWADNLGDSITFIDDGSFVASIDDGINRIVYDGSYTVSANSLSLSCSNGRQLVTEWDIRGNMLYLTWTHDDGGQKQLTLYKTSN